MIKFLKEIKINPAVHFDPKKVAWNTSHVNIRKVKANDIDTMAEYFPLKVDGTVEVLDLGDYYCELPDLRYPSNEPLSVVSKDKFTEVNENPEIEDYLPKHDEYNDEYFRKPRFRDPDEDWHYYQQWIENGAEDLKKEAKNKINLNKYIERR